MKYCLLISSCMKYNGKGWMHYWYKLLGDGPKFKVAILCPSVVKIVCGLYNIEYHHVAVKFAFCNTCARWALIDFRRKFRLGGQADNP